MDDAATTPSIRATGVRQGDPVTSPQAYTPGTLVAIRRSTTILPSLPFRTPETIPELGTRPAARKTASHGISCSFPPARSVALSTARSPSIRVTVQFSWIVTPSSSLLAASRRAPGTSRRNVLRTARSTATPHSRKMNANSAAMMPPPMTRMWSGRAGMEVRVWAVQTPGVWTPGMDGIRGRDPVAMMSADVSSRSPSRKRLSPSTLPSPRTTETPQLLVSASRIFSIFAWTDAICRMVSGNEKEGTLSRIPRFARFRAWWRALATSLRAQTTMHPWWRHWPPRPPLSTRVTSSPASPSFIAAVRPAGPPPRIPIMGGNP